MKYEDYVKKRDEILMKFYDEELLNAADWSYEWTEFKQSADAIDELVNSFHHVPSMGTDLAEE